MKFQIANLIEEKNQLFANLEKEKAHLAETEEQVQKLNSMKADLERQLQELSDRIAEMEDRNEDLQRAKKKGESEINDLKKKNQVRIIEPKLKMRNFAESDQKMSYVQELEMALRKAETEKQSREQNIRSLQDEMAGQDEAIARVNKEKKHQEEVLF